MKSEFLNNVRAKLEKIRQLHPDLERAQVNANTLPALCDLLLDVKLIASASAAIQLNALAAIGNNLAALLATLIESPDYQSESSLRSVVQAIKLMQSYCSQDVQPAIQSDLQALVVDDDSISRIATTGALDAAGLKYIELSNPVDAWDLARQNDFAIFILDVQMPAMTGHQLCEKIRSLPNHQKTPVIFLTGFSEEENQIQSVISGGSDFISKPLLGEELVLKTIVHLYKNRLAEGASV